MKLDTELKPGDIVLLKGLGCVLIVVLFMQLLIFPGLNKHEDLSASLEAKTAQKQEMEDTIANMPAVEETIAKQEETLKAAQDQYYGLMENQEIDELVTGVALNHSLFPVSLSIAETRDAVPDAYFLSERAAAADDADAQESSSLDTATAELDGTEDNADSGDSGDSADTVTPVYAQYVHITDVSLTVRGSEDMIRSFLNDIAVDYPGLQVRSFTMQEGTYLNENLDSVDTTTCSCVIAVYTCGDASSTGEETAQ